MALSLQFLHREEFESRTLRALGGGACMGIFAALALRLWAPFEPVVRLTLEPGYFAVLGAALAAARTAKGGGWGLRAALTVLPVFPFLFSAPWPLAQSVAGCIAAALVTWLGHGREQPGAPVPVALSAAAAGVLTPVGLYVQQVLDARLLGDTTLLSLVVGYACVALFWSIGTLPSHLVLHTDAVEARGKALQGTLSGEAKELTTRALGLYQQCKTSALRLPASPGRQELLGVVEKMASESFSLAEAHAGLTAQLDSVVAHDVDAQVKELRARAAATQDTVARRQLELAASSLGEELNHLDALGRKQERLLAQLHAQVALLERARVSFVGAQGHELGTKGEQAAQLARRLKGLGEESATPPAPVDDAARPATSAATRLNS
ncbi:autophagy-related protein 17 [Myxococcus fulvus]|uniref:autophagy-related protein 17 n=1 Tax=Myxococcus fulvus TaxID=33 RepID=UPI0020BE728A|nr:autophagy-related protein 17 [Myxococcus fulvus]MCK8501516.1 autophagy-related protein 17 [Myxococcus fulvus]